MSFCRSPSCFSSLLWSWFSSRSHTLFILSLTETWVWQEDMSSLCSPTVLLIALCTSELHAVVDTNWILFVIPASRLSGQLDVPFLPPRWKVHSFSLVTSASVWMSLMLLIKIKPLLWPDRPELTKWSGRASGVDLGKVLELGFECGTPVVQLRFPPALHQYV